MLLLLFTADLGVTITTRFEKSESLGIQPHDIKTNIGQTLTPIFQQKLLHLFDDLGYGIKPKSINDLSCFPVTCNDIIKNFNDFIDDATQLFIKAEVAYKGQNITKLSDILNQEGIFLEKIVAEPLVYFRFVFGDANDVIISKFKAIALA